MTWQDILRALDTIGFFAFWATIIGGAMKWMAGNHD